MHTLFHSLIEFLVSFAEQVGYFGIFLGMFIESTIIPIPSELVMIPAGMAAANGKMNLVIVTIVGILGNVLGAIFSYYISLKVGRTVLVKFGKYFVVKEKTLQKVEDFFGNHGPISVFVSRLLPGFRHFISIPAGIAKMNIKTFIFYTTAGSTIWTTVLSLIGFYVGKNQEVIGNNLLKIASYGSITSCTAVIIFYSLRKKFKNVLVRIL